MWSCVPYELNRKCKRNSGALRDEVHAHEARHDRDEPEVEDRAHVAHLAAVDVVKLKELAVAHPYDDVTYIQICTRASVSELPQ